MHEERSWSPFERAIHCQDLIQRSRLKRVLCSFGDTANETGRVSHRRFPDLLCVKRSAHLRLATVAPCQLVLTDTPQCH